MTALVAKLWERQMGAVFRADLGQLQPCDLQGHLGLSIFNEMRCVSWVLTSVNLDPSSCPAQTPASLSASSPSLLPTCIPQAAEKHHPIKASSATALFLTGPRAVVAEPDPDCGCADRRPRGVCGAATHRGCEKGFSTPLGDGISQP